MAYSAPSRRCGVRSVVTGFAMGAMKTYNAKPSEVDKKWVMIDADGVVTVGAGVSLDALLAQSVPRGWFVPVTTGTRQVTLGGAYSADWPSSSRCAFAAST